MERTAGALISRRACSSLWRAPNSTVAGRRSTRQHRSGRTFVDPVATPARHNVVRAVPAVVWIVARASVAFMGRIRIRGPQGNPKATSKPRTEKRLGPRRDLDNRDAGDHEGSRGWGIAACRPRDAGSWGPSERWIASADSPVGLGTGVSSLRGKCYPGPAISPRAEGKVGWK